MPSLAQGLGSTLGMACMLSLPPQVSQSLVIDVVESNLELEIAMTGTLPREFLVDAME